MEPHHHVVIIIGTSHSDERVTAYSVGFGFDPISNDFKVLRLLDVSEESMYYGNVEAEVYNLSTGSWRQLDSMTEVDVHFSDCPHFRNTVYLGGFFFWWTMAVGEERIVAFDFSNEVFIPITLPDLSAYPCFSQLTVLNKSFAIVVYPFGKEMNFPFVEDMDFLYPYPKHIDIPYAEATNFLDIWVLLEFGVMESWTKLIKINLCHLNRQLGLWRNGELFMENIDGQLVLYDPFTETEKNLQLDGIKESLQVVLYSQ